MGKTRSRRAGNRAGGTDEGGSRRRQAQEGARGRQRSLRPRGVGVAIFHVHDLKRVKKLVSGLHSKWRRRTRPGTGLKRVRTTGQAQHGDHPPLFLTDDKHLIGVAGSLAGANLLREFVQEALGDAVAHVQTTFVKAPKHVGGAGSGFRRRR